jgi:hypothetical protein
VTDRITLLARFAHTGSTPVRTLPGRVGKGELRRDPPSDSALYAVGREPLVAKMAYIESIRVA